MNNKEYVSNLIRLVLTNQISVREALLHFPNDTEDRNIKTAYYALAHYEADEDLRNRDALFRDEQDEYLMMIAELFENNKDLPLNIIKSYESYYPEINLPKKNSIIKFARKIAKFLNIK